jgi:hypothetical protein
MAKRKNQITTQWAARSIEMLDSPAYRALGLSEHRALARIEIEFANHAGKDNGRLPVTFDDFAEYGIRRSSIGPALTALETLGFIQITEHGKMAKAAEYRVSNRFLLLSRPPQRGLEPPPNKWKRFKTIKEAAAAVIEAQKRQENLKAASHETGPKASHETGLQRQNRQSRNVTTMSSHETGPLSIYREGSAPAGLALPLADNAPAPDVAPSLPAPTPRPRVTRRIRPRGKRARQ